MKAMKVLFHIFMPLFICLIIAFGISCAVFGRNDNSESGVVLSGDEQTIELSESFNDISIDTGAYDVHLMKSDSTKTTVQYKSREGNELTVKVQGGKLIVKQEVENFFGWFHFDFNWFDSNGAYVVIKVPEKIYNELNFNFSAGDVTVESIEAAKLSLGVSAGDIDVTVFAKEMDIGVSAGTVVLENATGGICEKIDVDVSAGELKLNGYETSEFDIDVSAGSADLYGLSGRGSVDVSAGGATLEMAKLNGDIDANVSAGQINIKLPEDSSVVIEADVSAGDVRTDLGGSSEHIGDDSTRTFGTGEYKITADTSAGNINILKK